VVVYIIYWTENVLALDSFIEEIASMFVVEILIQLLFICGALLFVCTSAHIQEEKRQKRTIALPWEKGFVGWSAYLFGSWGKSAKDAFDKSKVKYFDGDNT
jgi:hypothetical protein